jgi:pimeloyl-[acyl-carrier protein] methyl ester esterase
MSLQVRGGAEARQTLRTLQSGLAQRPAASSAGLQVGLDLLLHTDLRLELANLQMPSAWLFGGRDTLIPAQVATQIPRLATNTQQTVLASATHAPFLTDPSACLAWLEPLFVH